MLIDFASVLFNTRLYVQARYSNDLLIVTHGLPKIADIRIESRLLFPTLVQRILVTVIQKSQQGKKLNVNIRSEY